MGVVRKIDTERFELKNPNRTVYLWVDKKRGAKDISAGSGEIPVRGELPYHTHTVEEVMFIYRGEGIAVIDGETFPIVPETMVFVRPGVKHQFKNTGSEPLIFAWFYAPPGSEQALYTMVNK